jgi:hypothetical protein
MTAQRSDTVAEDGGATCSRVLTWHEPGPGTAQGLAMAGMDYLRAMAQTSSSTTSAEASLMRCCR